MRDVLRSVIDIVSLWEYLGMALGLSQAKLSEIEANNSDVKDRMKEVLRAWLHGQASGPTPSWQRLCQAVRDKLVDRPKTAKAIEEGKRS